MPNRIKALEILARDMVGDGKKPDLYFVTDRGVVVAIETDLDAAAQRWRDLAARSPRVESALEDRLTGVLASVAPESEAPGARLIRIDEISMAGG